SPNRDPQMPASQHCNASKFSRAAPDSSPQWLRSTSHRVHQYSGSMPRPHPQSLPPSLARSQFSHPPSPPIASHQAAGQRPNSNSPPWVASPTTPPPNLPSASQRHLLPLPPEPPTTCRNPP